MIILQTVSGDLGITFEGAGLLGESKFAPTATTYRDNSYIHKLNRALQAEMRAVSAYRSLQSSEALQLNLNPTTDLDQHLLDHQEATKELVRLIILSRGIPEDRTVVSLGFTKTFLQFCSRVPTRLFARVTVSTLAQLERNLLSHYERLLAEAPARDQESLRQLCQAANGHVESLK
jgi:hypothetical protein